MSNPIEVAARTYGAAWAEPDPAERTRLIEACFAADGRIVTRGDGIRGRAGLAAAIAAFFADPRKLRARIAGPVDVQGRNPRPRPEDQRSFIGRSRRAARPPLARLA